MVGQIDTVNRSDTTDRQRSNTDYEHTEHEPVFRRSTQDTDGKVVVKEGVCPACVKRTRFNTAVSRFIWQGSVHCEMIVSVFRSHSYQNKV